MAVALERLARRKAKRYGLDPNVFVRQIRQESGFDPSARSPAGALGVAQIMPATAKGWGVDPLDPEAALDAAARNMARYVKQFGGYEGALRAYNAGPGAVEKSKGYGETNAYVKRILGGKEPRFDRDVSPGSEPRWGEQQSFDREGFEEATRRSRAIGFLAKRRPGSLFARMPQEAPDPAQFTKTTQTFSPGRAPVDTAGQKSGKGRGRIRELFHDPGINLDEGKRTGAIGGHGKHVHAAFDNPKDREWAEKLARQMGLTVTSEGGGKHTEGSFHYQRLPGGESAALDVGGDPQKMLAYNRIVARRFRRGRRR